jgi:hypothetical protein
MLQPTSSPAANSRAAQTRAHTTQQACSTSQEAGIQLAEQQEAAATATVVVKGSAALLTQA